MKIPSSEHVVYTNCLFVFVLTFRTIYVNNMFWACSELEIFMYWTWNSMNNLLWYCGLVDTWISASDKDLPEQPSIFYQDTPKVSALPINTLLWNKNNSKISRICILLKHCIRAVTTAVAFYSWQRSNPRSGPVCSLWLFVFYICDFNDCIRKLSVNHNLQTTEAKRD